MGYRSWDLLVHDTHAGTRRCGAQLSRKLTKGQAQRISGHLAMARSLTQILRSSKDSMTESLNPR